MRALKIIFFSILIVISCDEGLSPDLAEEKSGFGGTVSFIGDWNPEINQTHVVAFKNPLISVDDFNVFNLSFVSEAIPNGTKSYDYSTNDTSALISVIEPGEIAYIAVAQSLRDTITLNRKDWIVIGLFYSENDSTNPGKINVNQGQFIENINIDCDFNNPPPQPPGGLENLNKIVNQVSK
jgi:hypothetical protein